MQRIRDWLYIGNYKDTTDLDLLRQHDIGAMLQLAEPVPQPEIASLYLDVTDGEAVNHDLIAQGMAFVCEQKAQERVVLVACGAGISRSTMFCMAALMEEENLGLFEAYEEVLKQHDIALPHHELCLSLAQYANLGISKEDIWYQLIAVQRRVKRG